MTDRIVWLLSRALVMPLLYLPPLRMRRRGKGHLPTTGPLLIVCTHVSIADPLVLMAAARPRRTHMMTKSEMFRHRPVAAFLRMVKAFPVRRGQADIGAIRHALALLARGECLVVFPEGHVSRTGHMRRGHPGAGFFSMRPGVVTVPAVVWDTQLFRGPARIVFGDPIDVSDIVAGPGPRKHRNREATDRIMTRLAAMAVENGAPRQPAPVGEPREEDRRRGRVTPTYVS
jgi:1-acyl-sn-glycerol-3-phosphate acyltransferase